MLKRTEERKINFALRRRIHSVAPSIYTESLKTVEDKIISDMCIERAIYYQFEELFNNFGLPNDLLLMLYKYTFKYISIYRNEKLKKNKLLLLHKI